VGEPDELHIHPAVPGQGITLPKTSNDDPIYDVRSNLMDTLQLLEACMEAGVRKVIY
jgi:nucleoside-diphosphate-sugar epimerase